MSEASLIPEAEETTETTEATETQETQETGETQERPEWLLEKYATADDQAQAYVELQKKFGGFTGAPEGEDGLFGYDTEGFIPENMEGVSLEDMDLENDSLVQSFVPILKEANMDQSTLNQLMGAYAGMIADQKAEAEAFATAQREQLGANADKRLANVSDYLKAHLDSDGFEEARGMLTSAASVKVIETLISKAKGTAMAADTPAPGVTAQEIKDLQFKTNEQGQRLYAIDPEYRAMVKAKMREVYGDGDYNEVIQ